MYESWWLWRGSIPLFHKIIDPKSSLSRVVKMLGIGIPFLLQSLKLNNTVRLLVNFVEKDKT